MDIKSLEDILESTCASTEELAVFPEGLPAVCAATVETMRSQLKNVSSAAQVQEISKCPAMVS